MTGNILIVDDEPDMRNLLQMKLTKNGYSVAVAVNGKDAWDQSKMQEFDVIVTDISMPVMDGIELLKVVKEQYPRTEVILATAHASLEVAVEGLRMGAFDFVQKPFQIHHLVSVVNRAAEVRKLREETSLYKASQIIFSVRDSDRLLEKIIEVTKSVMNADDVSLMLPDGNGEWYVAHAYGLPSEFQPVRVRTGERVAGRIAQERKPALIPGPLANEERFTGIESFDRVKSSIVYPLISGDEIIGVLNINRVSMDQPFGKGDLERAATLASQITLALMNARLISELIKRESQSVIGQLSAGITHEINNPVAYILTNLDFLQEKTVELARLGELIGETNEPQELQKFWMKFGAEPQMEEFRIAIADAYEGGTRIRDIVKDMRSFMNSNHESGEISDVNEALKSALRLTRAETKSHIEITTELKRGLHFQGSIGRLSQVFVNLIVNAAHALQTVDRPARRIWVRGYVREGEVRIEVSDNGPGISPENLNRIFEPFFTTKTGKEGTGLGLWLCKEIVKQLGGLIQVESTLGKGTAFCIRLPLAKERSSNASQEAEMMKTSKGLLENKEPPKPRVLFVDDDQAILRAYKRAFHRKYDVTFASGGKEALAILSENANFDLIVSDFLMPDKNGMELYVQTCKEHPLLKERFIFVTGAKNHVEVKKFLERTDQPVMEKPLDLNELRSMVDTRISLNPRSTS